MAPQTPALGCPGSPTPPVWAPAPLPLLTSQPRSSPKLQVPRGCFPASTFSLLWPLQFVSFSGAQRSQARPRSPGKMGFERRLLQSRHRHSPACGRGDTAKSRGLALNSARLQERLCPEGEGLSQHFRHLGGTGLYGPCALLGGAWGREDFPRVSSHVSMQFRGRLVRAPSFWTRRGPPIVLSAYLFQVVSPLRFYLEVGCSEWH